MCVEEKEEEAEEEEDWEPPAHTNLPLKTVHLSPCSFLPRPLTGHFVVFCIPVCENSPPVEPHRDLSSFSLFFFFPHSAVAPGMTWPRTSGEC